MTNTPLQPVASGGDGSEVEESRSSIEADRAAGDRQFVDEEYEPERSSIDADIERSYADDDATQA